MSNSIKKSLLSPILGGVILTLISFLYILITNYSQDLNQYTNSLFYSIKIVPLLFFIMCFISYSLSVPIGYIIFTQMTKHLKSEKFFVNLCLMSGFLISLVISFIDYYHFQSILKSFFIVTGLSLMATANANYFLILAGHLKIKETTTVKK